MGDFNCNMLSVPRGCGLEQFTAEYGLSQLINKPTRSTTTSSSLIDLLFTTVPELFNRSGCEELGISDHEMIYCELKCEVDRK